MSQFNTEANILNGRVFIVNRSELVGRWDAYFNHALKNSTLKTKYSMISISSAFKSYSGGTPSKANLSYWDGDVPWVSPKDFKVLMLVDTEDHITEEAIKNSSTTIVPEGCLLMVVRSGVLAHSIPVTITTKRMAFNQDVKAFIAQASISTEFLAVYFQVYNEQLLPLIVKHSTTVQSINTVQLNTLKIPVLPSHLQEKVVCLYLDAVTVKKQKEQQARALLAGIYAYLLVAELGITLPQQDNSLEKRIFTIQFKAASGQRFDPIFFNALDSGLFSSKYDYYKLNEIAHHFKSGFGVGRQDQVEEEHGIIQIRPTNINALGELIFHKNVYVPIDNLNENCFLNYGDVLFNNTNSQELVGKTSLVDIENQKLTYSNHITVIRTNQNELNPVYLQNVLNLYQKQKYFYSICTNWNNQSGVGVELLRSVKIPVPPINKQNEIVEHIQDIRTQAKQLQAEAAQILADAKAEVERLILGD